MPAFYDTYDYRTYWDTRKYEHESEVLTVKSFLAKIPTVDKAIEIGGGFGRMVPYYSYRVKKVILTDPSAKLLSYAKNSLIELKNITFLQSTLENLRERTRPNKFDLVIMVRVAHHLPNLNKAIGEIAMVTADNGYLIFEYANKVHFKSLAKQILKGNFGYLSSKEYVDVRSPKSIKKKTIAFVNHHPNFVSEILQENGFEILETRSVSNIRSSYVKSHIPLNLLIWVESILQKPLGYIWFGPSIFVLARKKG